MTLRRFRRGTVLVALLLLGVLAIGIPRPGPTISQAVLAVVLGVGLFAADRRPVRIRPNLKASLGTVPMVVAALLLWPPLAAALMGAVIFVSHRMLRRNWENTAFNAAQVVMAVLAGGLVAWPMRDAGLYGIVIALAGAVVLSGVGILVSSAGIAIHRHEPFPATLAGGVRSSWVQDLALDGIGVAIAALYLKAPWGAVLPLAALPLVFRMNRALEDELHSREELGRMLEAQRRFLTDVAHNVGNPLTTIQANLELVRSGRLPADERIALVDARQQSKRLADLWKRLRLLAETDEGMPLKRRPVDLAQLAGDVMRAYTSEAERNGVTIVTDASAPVEVNVDEDLIRQATANLVENAIRHSARGMSVSVHVDASRTGAVLIVTDHGPGIAPDRLLSIFDRFERSAEGGSGLGLAIARHAVERHGGRLEVESALGQGSSFRILLPPPSPGSARS